VLVLQDFQILNVQDSRLTISIPCDNSRGGTAYWNAPEIIEIGHVPQEQEYKVNPSHSYRDVYSFGLVSMLIALDGQWPMVPEEATKLKLNDGVSKSIATKLREEEASLCRTADQLALFIWLAEGTLRLRPEDRCSSLARIRVALTGKCVPLSHNHPRVCSMLSLFRESDIPDNTQVDVIPFSLMDSVTEVNSSAAENDPSYRLINI